MFVNTENNRKLIDFLLINSHSIGSNGIAYGKSGICLALFESSAFLKDEKLEDRAFGLLQEILVHPASDISFSNGAAGIGFLLSYLLQNSFLSGNYRELFGSQHRHIIETLKSPAWKYKQINELIKLILYLFYTASETSEHDLKIIKNKLLREVIEHTEKIRRTPLHRIERDSFYEYAFTFLGCNLLLPQLHQYSASCIEIFRDIHKQLEFNGFLCNSHEFGVVLQLYGHLFKQKEYIHLGNDIWCRSINNFHLQLLSLSQKLNLLICLDLTRHYPPEYDSKKCREQLLQEFGTKDNETLENTIVRSIPHKAFYVGLNQGVSRLILTNIWHEKAKTTANAHLPWWFLI